MGRVHDRLVSVRRTRHAVGYYTRRAAENFAAELRPRDDGRMKRMSLFVRGGAAGGLFAGLAAGAMVGPAHVGLFVGGVIGAAVGAIAGFAMDRDDRRGIARHRELDAIIGVSGGDMGAPPGSIPPGPLEDSSADESTWGSDWLTPPPPQTI
jgi:hypothetical protein